MDTTTLENTYKHFHYRSFKVSILPAFLGLLLIFTPDILDYQDINVIYSDRICGFALIILSLIALYKRAVIWLGISIGFWISIYSCFHKSILIFANDSLISFAIFAAICIPATRPDLLEVGPTLPKHSSFNPSSGGHRATALVISLLAWLQARYLTASSLVEIHTDSYHSISLIYPLMMTAFSLLVVLSLSGGERRWHTRPKIVLTTGITLLITIALTLIPIASNQIDLPYWMYPILTIPPVIAFSFSYDELKATCDYLAQFSKNKPDMIRTVIHGSSYYKESLFWEERSVSSFFQAFKQAFEGVSAPISLLLSIGLAINFIRLQEQWAFSDLFRNYVSICCWFIIVFSGLAFAKSLRKIRWLGVIFSIAILLSPVFFHIPPHTPILLPTIGTGIALIASSIGKLSDR